MRLLLATLLLAACATGPREQPCVSPAWPGQHPVTLPRTCQCNAVEHGACRCDDWLDLVPLLDPADAGCSQGVNGTWICFVPAGGR
jgi:hypothetical protein